MSTFAERTPKFQSFDQILPRIRVDHKTGMGSVFDVIQLMTGESSGVICRVLL